MFLVLGHPNSGVERACCISSCAGSRSGTDGSRGERLPILWAWKDACSQVVGRGMAMELREVTCEETAPGRHRVRMGRLELSGWHTIHEGYVVALCLGMDQELER